LLQQVAGGAHKTPLQLHAPWIHCSPLGQMLPQAPQLFGSVWVSTHWLLQQVAGGAHKTPLQLHAPWMHCSPLGQTLPQAPQLFASVSVSTHVWLLP
jgi:hypothetical protein